MFHVDVQVHLQGSIFLKVGRVSASHVPVRTRAIVMGSAEKKMADRAHHRTSHAARSHETRDERRT